MKTTRLLSVLLLVACATTRASAGVAILSPATGSSWTAGKEETIRIEARRGLKDARIRIFPPGQPEKPYLDRVAYPTRWSSPEFVIDVPKTSAPAGQSQTVIVEVAGTQSDGGFTFDQIKVHIRNP